MFLNPRQRFVLACAVGALALLACHARAQPITAKQSDLPRLIEAARQAGVEIQYEQTTTDEGATGKGSSVDASGDAASVKHDAGAPAATLRGGTASSGGASKDQADGKEDGSHLLWFRVLCAVLCLVCVLDVLYSLYRTPPNVAGAVKAGAGAVAAAVGAAFPAATLFVLAGVALAGVVLWILAKHNNSTAQTALATVKSAYDAVVDGVGMVAKDNPIAAAPVLLAIKAQATPADAAHIHQTAAANGNPITLS